VLLKSQRNGAVKTLLLVAVSGSGCVYGWDAAAAAAAAAAAGGAIPAVGGSMQQQERWVPALLHTAAGETARVLHQLQHSKDSWWPSMSNALPMLMRRERAQPVSDDHIDFGQH